MKNNKLKVFKNIGKKFIIAGSLIGMLLSPLSKTEAKAYEDDSDSFSYYELEENENSIMIKSEDELKKVNRLDSLDEMCLSNITFSSPINIENLDIRSLKIENCNFNSNEVKLPNNLEILDMYNTKFNDYSCISKLDNLEELNIRKCNIKNLQMVPKNIYALGIYQTQLSNLNGIENCPDITFLEIYDTNISNINEIKNLSKLDTLVLCGCFITDISPVKDLKLTYLDVSNSTKIKTLDPVTNINTLLTLYAYNLEMAYTDKLVNFVESNNITTNISKESLSYQQKVKQIANNLFNENMKPEEKIEKIINYVIDNIEFDDNFYYDDDYALDLNRNALKYALEGKGCCKNYTELTNVLLTEAGIECYDILSSDHIWTLVKVDGEFYWIDSTFIDSYNEGDLKDNEYYMTQDEEFIENHQAINVPEGAYSKIKNDNIKENSITNENIEENTITDQKLKQTIINSLKKKKAPLAASIGILCAFGIATCVTTKKIKESKKNKEQNNENTKAL